MLPIPENGQSPKKYPVWKYPDELGKAPYDKWIFFQARSGRHVVRDQVVPDSQGVDRPLAAVALYLNETALRDSLTVTYETTHLGPFWGALVEYFAQTGTNFFDLKAQTTETLGAQLKQMFTNLGAKISDTWDAATQDGSELGQTVLEAIKAQVHQGIEGLPGAPHGASSIATGQRPNPRTDIYFDSQSFRQHTWEFLLVPRSRAEAQKIDQIINFFQFYMLPSYNQTQFLDNIQIGSLMMGFPYEFEISFHDEKGNRLKHVNQVGRSVLTNVSVDHAGGGKTAFIKDGDEYYPVATKLQLQFQEVRLLARDSPEIQRPGGIDPKSSDMDPRV